MVIIVLIAVTDWLQSYLALQGKWPVPMIFLLHFEKLSYQNSFQCHYGCSCPVVSTLCLTYAAACQASRPSLTPGAWTNLTLSITDIQLSHPLSPPVLNSPNLSSQYSCFLNERFFYIGGCGRASCVSVLHEYSADFLQWTLRILLQQLQFRASFFRKPVPSLWPTSHPMWLLENYSFDERKSRSQRLPQA